MTGIERSHSLFGYFFVKELVLDGNGSRKPWKCFSEGRQGTWSVLSF